MLLKFDTNEMREEFRARIEETLDDLADQQITNEAMARYLSEECIKALLELESDDDKLYEDLYYEEHFYDRDEDE